MKRKIKVDEKKVELIIIIIKYFLTSFQTKKKTRLKIVHQVSKLADSPILVDLFYFGGLLLGRVS